MIDLLINKTADRNFLFVGFFNTVRYSITIKNVGNETACNVNVRELLSSGAHIIPGSFHINGCKMEINSCKSTVLIKRIRPGEVINIKVAARLDEDCIPDHIKNKVVAIYIENGCRVRKESNELVIPVINVDVCIIKSVDRRVARIGDILTYTISIKNNSNVDINNITIYDIIPECLIILPTIFIGSEERELKDLASGEDIGTIVAGGRLLIRFMAEVVCAPKPPILKNIAKIKYEYTVTDNGIPVTSAGEAISFPAVTKVISDNC